MTIRQLNRRTVLRGVGTAMALPLLDAMLPRAVLGNIEAGLSRRELGGCAVFVGGADVQRFVPTLA